MSVATSGELIYQLDNGVATITLNRSERKNTLSTSLVDKFAAALEEVDASNDVKVVVPTSLDCDVFCAGMDLKEAVEIKKLTGEDVLSKLKDPFHQRMRDCKKPIKDPIGAYQGLQHPLAEAKTQIELASL